MPFNQEEQKIIEWGVNNGKTKDQVKQAIINYRSGITPSKEESKEPTFAGQVLRESIKPFAKVGTSLVNLGQDIAGVQETQPFSGEYLGEVKKVGEGFDVTKGISENLPAIKDAVKTGVDIGLWLPGGGGAVNVLQNVSKGAIKEAAKIGAKTGATIGFTGGLSTGLEEGATLWSTLKNTALGTVAGAGIGAGAGIIPGVTKATTEVVSKTLPKVFGKATTLADNRIPKLLSIFTGEDNSVVKVAMEFPEIADKGIMGGDEALRKAIQTGAETSLKARQDFSKSYNEAFNILAQRNPDKLASRQKVLYGFVDDLEKAGAKVKGGKIDFSTSTIAANPGEASKINTAYEAIQNWDDWTLEGVNLLKQLVGKLTRFPTEAGGTSKSPFLGKFYNFLDTEIKNNLSKEDAKIYSEMNKKFSSNIDLYDEMVDAFNSGDPFTKLAGLFGKNKDTLRQVIDFYEKTTGEKISPIVAGRTLAEEKPAQFGFLNPRQWIDFFIPPEQQAKVVTKTGKVRQSLKKSNIQNPNTGINQESNQIMNTIKKNTPIKSIIPQTEVKVQSTTKRTNKAIDDVIAENIDELRLVADKINKRGKIDLNIMDELDILQKAVVKGKLTAAQRLAFNELAKKLNREDLIPKLVK